MTKNDSLIQELEEAIKHQNQWRSIMSVAYFTAAGTAILSSAAATVVAGIGMSEYAAVLAGATTVLYGLEKGLLLREKWAHHLSTSAQLEALRLSYVYGELGEGEVSKLMGEIGTEYALKLPIAAREES